MKVKIQFQLTIDKNLCGRGNYNNYSYVPKKDMLNTPNKYLVNYSVI